MAAKPDAAHGASSTTTPPMPAAAAGAAAAPKKGGAMAQWIPVIAAVILAPVLSWAVAEFVLLPRMTKKLASVKVGEAVEEHAAPAAEAKAEGHGEKGGKEGKEGKEGGNPATYEFQNLVVNLAGTMGTRYLKTTFIVTGTDAHIKEIFDAQKAKLTDITLNVLSSLSLADLEEPGAKNVLREKLVLTYNQALGKKVAEQVYFSDFVVQ